MSLNDSVCALGTGQTDPSGGAPSVLIYTLEVGEKRKEHKRRMKRIKNNDGIYSNDYRWMKWPVEAIDLIVNVIICNDKLNDVLKRLCCLARTVSRRCETAIDFINVSEYYFLEIYSGSLYNICLLYTSPSPRDRQKSRMPSSA